MNVLSLFDGMSCGQQALEKCGIQVHNYFASEIDKYAIKVTMANYPNTIQLGSVVGVDGYSLPKIDLLIGGSPCQSFSFAGKRKGMSTKDEQEILTLEHYLQLKSEGYEFEGQSYLFWEYMRLLYEVRTKNPDVYFLLENVEMGEKWENVLSRAIGVNGIHINSALVSAQNRKRIYWTNIGMKPSGLFGDLESIIQQPKDKGILLKDVLESEVDEKYFLSEKMLDYLNRNTDVQQQNGNVFKYKPTIGDEKGKSITTKEGNRMDDNFIIQPIFNNQRLNETLKNNELPNQCAFIDSYNQSIYTDKTPCISTRINASNNYHIYNPIVHNTMPRSSTSGKGGTGHLSRNDGKTYCLDTGNTNAVEINCVSIQSINAILTPKRTEYGKQIRKDYESGNIKTQRKNIQQLEPRNDNKTNCLTSVQKDNLVIEQKINAVEVREVRQLSQNNKSNGGTQPYQQDRIYDIDGISPALQAQLPNGSTMINTSRIRRLTPIECERLQTVKDNYTNHVSDSQRYKMLGNGWTVDVIAHIFNYLKF